MFVQRSCSDKSQIRIHKSKMLCFQMFLLSSSIQQEIQSDLQRSLIRYEDSFCSLLSVPRISFLRFWHREPILKIYGKNPPPGTPSDVVAMKLICGFDAVWIKKNRPNIIKRAPATISAFIFFIFFLLT